MVKILEQSEDRPLSADLRKLFRDTLDKVAAAPFARKVTRSEESECGNGTNKTIYIDSEETRIATVKRVVNSMIEKVEAELDYERPNEPVTQKRTTTSFNEQPAKRVKREDSEASDKSKASNKSKASSSSKESSKSKEGKKVGKGKRTSTESSSDSDSDSESSSSDTSSSNSSEDSDSSEEEEQANGKIDETKERNDRGDWIKEQQVLMSDCLAAMEECACRFPEHFKSRYRLAHYYFRSKLQRNVEKAHQLLLGPQGLFAERKPSNFFNGVWRIPSNEIDRPGSFASHMSRTVLLLVDILRETRDHKMLFDLALRLRDTPESDKKYLRDPEREELSREAFKLSVQALRTKVALAKNSVDRKAVLLEVFKTFKRCAKLWDQKQGPLITLLNEAYSQYNTEDSNSGFDAAVKFCTQELTAQKAAVASQKSAVAATTIATVTPAPTPAPALQPHTTSNVIQAVPTAPTLVPPMPTSLARPPPMRMAIPARRGRGRPPGGGLLRQIFKPPRTSPGHLAKYKYYQDQLTVQMQQLKANTDLMTLRMMNDPKYQAACRESQMLQQMVQLQAMSAKRSESTSSSLSAADSLLAPAKVSVFSAQNVLLPSQLPKQRDVTISSVPNNPSISCQRAVRPQYAQRKNQKQTVTKLSPFQLKTAMASNTNITQTQSSLQHKLLSAKMAKPSTPSSMTSVLKSNNELTITVSSSPDKSKPALSQSETTTALSSRGVSITPSTRLPNVKPANELSLFTTKQKTAAQLKPPEIKIPKDITIGRSLSFSPVTSKSLSPSTSKEVTVTILKSSSDAKGSKSNSPVNVSLFDSGKRTQISPGGRNSPSAVLRTGALTIMPAKPNQTVTARPIPKADFSISLKKDEDATKKDKSSVIVID